MISDDFNNQRQKSHQLEKVTVKPDTLWYIICFMKTDDFLLNLSPRTNISLLVHPLSLSNSLSNHPYLNFSPTLHLLPLLTCSVTMTLCHTLSCSEIMQTTVCNWSGLCRRGVGAILSLGLGSPSFIREDSDCQQNGMFKSEDSSTGVCYWEHKNRLNRLTEEGRRKRRHI